MKSLKKRPVRNSRFFEGWLPVDERTLEKALVDHYIEHLADQTWIEICAGGPKR
jgi:hypothetical protein